MVVSGRTRAIHRPLEKMTRGQALSKVLSAQKRVKDSRRVGLHFVGTTGPMSVIDIRHDLENDLEPTVARSLSNALTDEILNLAVVAGGTRFVSLNGQYIGDVSSAEPAQKLIQLQYAQRSLIVSYAISPNNFHDFNLRPRLGSEIAVTLFKFLGFHPPDKGPGSGGSKVLVPTR